MGAERDNHVSLFMCSPVSVCCWCVCVCVCPCERAFPRDLCGAVKFDSIVPCSFLLSGTHPLCSPSHGYAATHFIKCLPAKITLCVKWKEWSINPESLYEWNQMGTFTGSIWFHLQTPSYKYCIYHAAPLRVLI